MKCPWYYEWVKLPRKLIPEGNGVMGDFIKLAGKAAFRKESPHIVVLKTLLRRVCGLEA